MHRNDCNNIPQDIDEDNRLIEVEWVDKVEANYNVEIEITAQDRRDLLNEVLQAISESKTSISAVTGRADKNKQALIHITVLIRNKDHLTKLMERIKRVRDVYTVERIRQ